MIIEKYNPNKKKEWDEFITKCKNYHFIFERDYMDYHKDRFCDYSLIFRDRETNNIVAVLPSNILENTLYSHQGLTFGGFLITEKCNALTINEILNELRKYCKQNKIYKIIYKSIPYIFHKNPSQEDLYQLHKEGAILYRRDLSSVIDLSANFKYSKGRKWSLKKAQKNKDIIVIENDYNFEEYWNLLNNVLKNKHNVLPTHNLNEIIYLKNSFPNNIELITAYINNNLVAGIILFITDTVVHTQYISVNEIGKEHFVLDLLIHQTIEKYKQIKKYFSFGISTENEGLSINEGLLRQKEGFGASSITHDFYEINF